jgi:chondroitin 4-sulfotransferase 11
MSVFKNTIKRWIRWHKNRRSDQILESLGVAFVHIPKTGGTSIRSVFQSHGPSSGRYPQLGNHATAEELRSALGRKTWARLRSIAVVRNPWDWSVSSYFWWIQRAERHHELVPIVESIRAMGSFDAFVKSPWFLRHVHNFEVGDLSTWVCRGGQILITDILRFESLGTDWADFVSRNHLPFQPLPHENKTQRLDYRSYYDPETAEIVARKFQTTIRLFGYRFDP